MGREGWGGRGEVGREGGREGGCGRREARLLAQARRSASRSLRDTHGNSPARTQRHTPRRSHARKATCTRSLKPSVVARASSGSCAASPVAEARKARFGPAVAPAKATCEHLSCAGSPGGGKLGAAGAAGGGRAEGGARPSEGLGCHGDLAARRPASVAAHTCGAFFAAGKWTSNFGRFSAALDDCRCARWHTEAQRESHTNAAERRVRSASGLLGQLQT